MTPDILNFAKQVTNGAQPLGGVVATKEIYDTSWLGRRPEYMLEFPHGYTYSATPWPAHGIAALDIPQRKTRSAAEGAVRTRERRARPEGRQACGRHPQLWLAARSPSQRFPASPPAAPTRSP